MNKVQILENVKGFFTFCLLIYILNRGRSQVYTCTNTKTQTPMCEIGFQLRLIVG